MKVEGLLVLFASTKILGQTLHASQHHSLERKLSSKRRRTLHGDRNKLRTLKKEKCGKSNEKSCAPSSVPSLISPTPSTTLSAMPSLNPTLVPSLLPTTAPSFLPTLAPSPEPSMNPTPVPTCAAETVLGKTYFLQSIDSTCYKLEFFTGGKLFSSPSCSYDDLLEMSGFTDAAEGIAFFSGIWDFELWLIEDPSASGILFEAIQRDGRSFVVNLIFPTCSVPSTTSSIAPTYLPSRMSSLVPSLVPSTTPSVLPTAVPSDVPTSMPSTVPSLSPSLVPSVMPSLSPSSIPSLMPSTVPTSILSTMPSTMPSLPPSAGPSVVPSLSPSSMPSVMPTSVPSMMPSISPYCNTVEPEIILPAKFKQTSICFKVEVKAGGKLYADTNDTNCLPFKLGRPYTGSPISSYKRTEPNGVAIYGRPGPWSGEIQVFQDPKIAEPMLVIVESATSTDAKVFGMVLTVPSCLN